MTSGANSPILWFKDEPVPGLVVDPSVIVGGTSLLREFFSIAAEHRRVRADLSIAVPFVGSGVIDADTVIWDRFDHKNIDLRLVVRRHHDAEVAADQLCGFKWRSIQIGVTGRLHAKLYTFQTTAMTGVALVGSHNLSGSGRKGNLEAGTLMIGRRPGSLPIISDIHDTIRATLRDSTLIVDTTSDATLSSTISTRI